MSNPAHARNAPHAPPPVLATRRDRLFLLLAAFFLGNALLAEMIGGKLFQVETRWHVFTLSVGVILWPVVFLVSDMVNEYFGRNGVKRLTFLAAGVIAYAFVALFVAGMIPAASFSPVDDASFRSVFLQSQWIIVGSIAAFLTAQLVDVSVFWMVRRRTGRRLLWLRATGSTLVSQLIDTFIVGFIGLHLPTYFGQPGIDFPTFVNVATSGYVFKFVVAIGITPLLYFVHWIIDGYLGEAEANKIVDAVAEGEVR